LSFRISDKSVYLVFVFSNKSSKGEDLDSIKQQIDDNLNYMNQISDTFPRKNGLYLNIILGSVCVSILNKEEKLVEIKIIILLLSL
jgi:hypothetical protein